MTESFTGDKKVVKRLERQLKVVKWLESEFIWLMNQYYNPRESEFAVAVAAAAFAIYSYEEAEAEHIGKLREELERSRTKIKSRKDDTATRLLTRRGSGKEVENAGETSTRKPSGQVRRGQEGSLAETKAGAWERAQMEKIRKWYQKMRADILAWENNKKREARLQMERKQKELEERRERYRQRYQMKIARIDKIAGGARAQVEEKRRNEEAYVKEKARKISTTGQVPVSCFCFQCA